MLTRIRKVVAAPVFEDEEKTRAAGLLNTILLILAAMTLVIVPSLVIIDPTTAMFNLSIGAAVMVMVLGIEFIMRRDYLRAASMLLASFLLAMVTATIYVFGGIRSNVASAYILVVAIAALLLSGRAAVIFGLLSMLAALGVFYAEISGAIVIPMPVSVEFVHWLLLSAVLGMGTLLLRYAVRSIAAGFEQARQEIAERKAAEEALRESEERFRLLVEYAADAFFLHDSDSSILDVNRRACESLGYTREELLSLSIQDFDPAFDLGELEQWEQMVPGEPVTVERVHIRKDGTTFPVEVRLGVFKSGERWLFLGLARDITERKRTEEELAYMATHDALTGLPNRWLLNDRLTLELARAQRYQQKLAVMLLDLDDFKRVNDTLGHTVGDKLLQDVGERLTRFVRKSDTVARMGGDEFMLLLLFPGIRGEEDAAKIAQRILEAFRRPFVFDGHEILITTSIGVAIYPDDGKDADTLVKNADIAMYRAKERGRDNYQRYSTR